MAASHTLSHSLAIPQISKLGVLTLYGYGIRITMQAGHLQIEDGIGPDRRKFRLPRVNHRLKRLVCIGDDGFITLAALRWLSDVGASFQSYFRVKMHSGCRLIGCDSEPDILRSLADRDSRLTRRMRCLITRMLSRRANAGWLRSRVGLIQDSVSSTRTLRIGTVWHWI